MDMRRTWMSAAARMALGGAVLLIAGCLDDGTRPRISEMYPEPALQMPQVTTTQTQTTTQVYTAPGTTFHYEENTYPQTQSEPYWDRDYYRRYPDRRPRYIYPEAQVRCDNATGTCVRWSKQQGRYLPDNQISRRVYGPPPQSPTHRSITVTPQSNAPGN